MMLEGWRWYGPDDPVSLDDVRQAGATDIVSALHQVPIGEAWTRKAVEERKNFIERGQPGRSQLTWSVVESIPIPDDVKRLGAKATRSIETWIASLEAVAAAGYQDHLLQFHAGGRLVPHRSRMGAAERRPGHAL
ncbi:D-mannonate dehydratase [Bradyrhizobium sp. LM3.2]